MTVFTQVFNLSDNVKYMNYKIDTTPSGGGNALQFTKSADRKEYMHRFLEMITTDRDNQQIPSNKTLGWQRIDGADSSGDIFEDTVNVDPLNDSSSAVYGFIRAKTYDYSTTGHWKYVRFKLFERNEDNLSINQIDQTNGARYLSGNRVLVMRYDTYADFGVTAEDSAAVVDSINAGINSAEADGYGSTNLDAGTQRGSVYASANQHIGYDAAYNSANPLVNQDWNINNNTGNTTRVSYKRTLHGTAATSNSLPGSNTYNGFNATNSSRYFPNDGTNAAFIGNTSIGNYPLEIERKGQGLGYNFFQAMYGVNGFGDSDVGVKNSYGELKILLDGNGTMWGFGDQDRTGSNTDSASGTNGFKGVNATGADARYLAIFNTQHQDDNPEKIGPYNTILFAGEYKKEFGEPVSSGYLHNGIKFNAHNFLMNNGVATPPNYKIYEEAGWNTANANVNENDQPVSSTVVSNFNSLFTSKGNNIANSNTIGMRNTASYTDIGNNAVTQTAATNTNYNQLAGVGNWLMGLSMDKSAEAYASNRSRSMGQANDPEMQWRSKAVGNSNISNSTNNTYGAGTYAGSLGWEHDFGWIGNDGAQFALTEYPQRPSQALVGSVNTAEVIQEYDAYTTAATGRSALSATRMHMGYLGYVGHVNNRIAYSLNELFFGSRHSLFGHDDYTLTGNLSTYEPGTTSGTSNMANLGPSLPLVSDQADSPNGSAQDAINIQREYVQEFHPIANSQSQYSVYEPILSVGTLAGNGGGIEILNDVTNNSNVVFNNTNYVISGVNDDATSTTANLADDLYRYGNADYVFGNIRFSDQGQPGGVAKKRSAFALLGRTFGLKIFGPYQHDKYNFLDAVSVQLDDDGFYAVNPNNAVDHWIVPANTDQASFLFKK